MPAPTTPARRRNTDTSKATEASRRAFAIRRAHRLVAELEEMGYKVTTTPELPTPPTPRTRLR